MSLLPRFPHKGLLAMRDSHRQYNIVITFAVTI